MNSIENWKLDGCSKFENGNIYIKNDDCLIALKQIPDNSIDSIVTDPPYGLSFMGKKWDYDVPSIEIWKECLRVLKPGGHLLSFAGTRTQHRMAVNIEDAGFEIRDIIAWAYGCYSEDTECLTDSGWKRYTDIEVGVDKILQWDHSSNKLSWYSPDEVLVYPAPVNMINIVNRHTDQLLTENHNVYAKIKTHSRNEKQTTYTRINANKIKNHWQKDFPVAGELISGYAAENPYMVGWWLTDAWMHGDGKACMFSQSKYRTLDLLRDALRLSDCTFSEYVKKGKKDNHKDEHIFYVTGNLSNYLISNFPERKLEMEVLQWDWDSRTLLLNGLMDGDGSHRINSHVGTFWSRNRERLDVFQALCLSLNIRSNVDYNNGCVYLNRKTNTTQLQNKHPIKNISYDGKNVWCLKTETGAFVVRRNGRAFISGNSGFPKSLDISKAIDKKLGAERGKVRIKPRPETSGTMAAHGDTRPWIEESRKVGYHEVDDNVPVTEAAKQWDGWGTALKPSLEPITVARKPLVGTCAENVLKHGTGGLNIDGCRIKDGTETNRSRREYVPNYKNNVYGKGMGGMGDWENTDGRWPANFIHDGSEDVLDIFPTSKESAARFFYCAKASKSDRDEGLDEFEKKKNNGVGALRDNGRESADRKNVHPTVKPTKLMRYLVRLVTPPNGIVLDPFMGSGSTGKAAILEGFSFIGIERDEEYCEIAKARIEHVFNGIK